MIELGEGLYLEPRGIFSSEDKAQEMVKLLKFLRPHSDFDITDYNLDDLN